MNILVSDDNAKSCSELCQQIVQLGHVPKVVRDSKEAMEALDQVHYDLLLLDAGVSFVRGLALLGAARVERSRGESVRVLLMSVQTIDLMGLCQEIGVDGYLHKPISLSALQAAVLDSVDDCPLTSAGNTDLERIAELLEMAEPGENLLQEMVSVFAGRGRTLLSVMAESQDPVQVMGAAHELKGSALSLGALEVVRSCVQIERQLKVNAVELEILDRQVQEAVASLKSIISFREALNPV